MQMPLPHNTLPMMTGTGPFGAIAMGGMFTTVKVRKGLARHDYKDPGWYRHPAGSLAYEWAGPDAALPANVRAESPKPAEGETLLKATRKADHHGH
jgi:hypothetical protein